MVDDSFKSFLIENLMINYSTLENDKKIDDKELLSYYIIIINNNNIISKDYQINFNKLNEIIK